MKDGCAFMFAKLVAGEVTRGDGCIIGVIGNAEAAELLLNTNRGTRRIGEKHEDCAVLAESSCCGNGAGKSPVPVMHHAPNVHDPRAITRADLLDGADDGNGGSDQRHVARLETRSLRVKFGGCATDWPNRFLVIQADLHPCCPPDSARRGGDGLRRWIPA